MLYIVVPTHTRYEHAWAALHTQLSQHASHIGARVVVVRTGAATEWFRADADLIDIGMRHNLYEYTGIMGVHAATLADPRTFTDPTDRFLLLHDTCHLGAGFGASALQLYETALSRGADIVWASTTGQCNLCMFTVGVARRVFDEWSNTYSMTKRLAIEMEHNQDPRSLKRLDVAHLYVKQPAALLQGTVDWYRSGVSRHRLYFPALDVVKLYCHVDLTDAKTAFHPECP